MQNPTKTIPVYETTDYSIFKSLTGNRTLYENHVKRLVKVIKSNPSLTEMNPIKVNEKLEVIDGQHRLAAFKLFAKSEGKYPSVNYAVVKGASLPEARALNAGSKPWHPHDYAEAFVVDGNKNYKTYLEFEKKFQVQHNVLARYLSGEEGAIRNFKDGGFIVGDKKEAEENIERLLEAAKYYPLWPNQSFGMAFYRVMKSPVYQHSRMIKQLKKFPEVLTKVPTRTSELIVGLNTVYNLGCSVELNLQKQ